MILSKNEDLGISIDQAITLLANQIMISFGNEERSFESLGENVDKFLHKLDAIKQSVDFLKESIELKRKKWD